METGKTGDGVTLMRPAVKFLKVLHAVYMAPFVAASVAALAIGTIVVIMVICLMAWRSAEFAAYVYTNHLTLALGLTAALMAGALGWRTWRIFHPPSVTLRTQNGFWGFLAFSLAMAIFVGGLLVGHLKRSGMPEMEKFTTFAIATLGVLALILWPTAKNLYQVWRASLPSRSTTRARALPSRYRKS